MERKGFSPRLHPLMGSIWSRGDRGPSAAVWDDGHERMLVVRERRTLVVASPLSLHRVPGGGPAVEELEDVERDKQDVRVEVPRASGQFRYRPRPDGKLRHQPCVSWSGRSQLRSGRDDTAAAVKTGG